MVFVVVGVVIVVLVIVVVIIVFVLVGGQRDYRYQRDGVTRQESEKETKLKKERKIRKTDRKTLIIPDEDVSSWISPF